VKHRIIPGRRLAYALTGGFFLVCALQMASLGVLFVSQQKQEASWRQQREQVSTAMSQREDLEKTFATAHASWIDFMLRGEADSRRRFESSMERMSVLIGSAQRILGTVEYAPLAALSDVQNELTRQSQQFFLPLANNRNAMSTAQLEEATREADRHVQEIREKLRKFHSDLAATSDNLMLNIDKLAAVKLIGITSLVMVALVITGYIGWLSLRAVRFFREAEEERRVAERQGKFFKAVLDQLPAGVSVRSAPDGGTVMVNRAARQFMGLARIPQSVTQVSTEGVFHPDGKPYRTSELPLVRSLTRGESVSGEEMVLETAGGGRTTVLCSSKPITDENQQPMAAITIFQDITDRKKLESSLEQKTRELDRMVREQQQQILRLTQMQEISAKVSALKTVQDVSREVLPAIAQMLGVEKCVLRLADSEMRKLEVIAPAFGLSDAQLASLPPLPISRDDSPLMRCFWEDQLLMLNDVASDADAEPYRPLFLQIAVHSMLSLRLAAHGKPVGVLTVYDRLDGQPFTTQDAQLLRILASAIAIALDNARLYESLRERNDQLATLLQEAHHRIKNNLAMITSLLSLEMSYGMDKSSAQICSSTIARVESIARVHALLTQETTRGVPVQPLIEQLVNSLVSTSLTPRQKIDVQCRIEPLQLPAREATALALVTSELVSNALRHGFAGRDTGCVRVELRRRNGDAVLEVVNDGHAPATSTAPQRQGLGMRIVEALTSRDLRGTFAFAKKNGLTSATVQFRVPTDFTETDAAPPATAQIAP
jgi:PAS domain S-box-containing protein